MERTPVEVKHSSTWSDSMYECTAADIAFYKQWGPGRFGWFECPECGKRVKEIGPFNSCDGNQIKFHLCHCEDCGKIFKVYFL
jgi:hypothetical protein